MEKAFAFALESRGSVWHNAFALCCSDFAAEIGLARLAEFTLAALGCTRDDR